MLEVTFALVPGIAVCAWLFGWSVIVHCLLAVATALACEACMLALRRRPLYPFLTDGSAMLTGLLLALSLPALAPWWITVLGTAFAVIVVKHMYGGLGSNPFNPAMAGYVFLLISFPVEMTTWPVPFALPGAAPGPGDAFGLVFSGAGDWDAVSGATPLDRLKTGLGMLQPMAQIQADPMFGIVAGRGWEWLSLAWLGGGLWLVYRRIISWHIPVGLIGAVFLLGLLFYLGNPHEHAPPLFHVFGGATMIGAFFIATDPVTAPSAPAGRLLFGIGAGVLIYVIRSFGGYPDAVAFAVLLMNITAPTIDRYTRPRVFGHSR